MRRLLLSALSASMLVALPSTASAGHSDDVNCSAFQTQSAAQSHLLAHPGDPDTLDGDSDGRACQDLPCPCGATGAAPSPLPAQTPPSPYRSSSDLERQRHPRHRRRHPQGEAGHRQHRHRAADRHRHARDAQAGNAVECGGPDATSRMRKLALRNGRGVSIVLRTDPTQDTRDRYGRRLAHVSRAGVDFGRTMVLSGWATSHVDEQSFQRVAAYRSAQSAARAAPRGVWRSCGGDFHRAR